MTKKIYTLIFLFIVLTGFVLRFFELGKVPESLNWDEVSWGYNAYSVLTTGKDEHGQAMPLSFEAFGDYKQPVYVYLTSLSIGIFGLSDFAVRFPSALLGSLSIIFVWLLVFNVFYREKFRDKISLFAMFFFAISPWSIQFSRVAFEANVGLFFLVSGISFFLLGVNTRKIYLSVVGIFLLSISCYSYHSNKIFTPLLFFAFLLYVKVREKITKAHLVFFAVIFITLNLLWLVDARTTARGRSVTFVSNQTPILKDSVEQIIVDENKNDFFGELFHNRRIIYANYYFENYLKHFGLSFLFVEGDNARHHPFGMGIIYLASLPLIIIGFAKLNYKKYWIIPAWMLMAPLASALAVDAPNASRSLVFLPTWQIFESMGFLVLLSLRHQILRKLSVISVSLLLLLNFVYFLHNYFNHTNSEYGIYWQNGYREAMVKARELSKDNPVFISNKYEQPYIFYLFHNRINPYEYINSGGSRRIKEECFFIENVYFGTCDDKHDRGSILISQESFENESFEKISEIVSSEGKVVGHIYRQM